MLDENVVKGCHVKGFFLAFIPDPNDPPPYPPRAPIPLLSDLARWGRVGRAAFGTAAGSLGGPSTALRPADARISVDDWTFEV